MPNPNSSAPVPPPQAALLDDAHSTAPTFDMRGLYHALIEKFWVIALCFIVGVLVTAHMIKEAKPLYAATATLVVEEEDKSVLPGHIKPVMEQNVRSIEVLNTIVVTLKSRGLLERVLTNHLAKDPSFGPLFEGAPSMAQRVETLAGYMDVKLRRGTRLIDITVVHTLPTWTERIANAVAKEYLQRNVDTHTTSTADASELLKDEALNLKKRLQESEEALRLFKEKAGLSVDPTADTVMANLRAMNSRATEAKGDTLKIATEYDQLQRLGSNIAAMLTLPAVANDPKVVEFQVTLSKLENDYALLRNHYGPKHPRYIQATTQMRGIGEALTNAILAVPGVLKARLETARAGEAALVQALTNQDREAKELNKQMVQYNALFRDMEGDKALYQQTLNRLKELSMTMEVPPTRVSSHQPAYVPESPFSPDKPRMLTKGLMIGFVVGVLLALVLNALDSSFKTVDQAEDTLKLPVLSTIQQMREVKKGQSQLVVGEKCRSPGAESFRTLRTSLAMLGRSEQRRTFLFTSALPQEGKTFCALNCAATLAQQGLRTLLIDGDLRRPSVEVYLHGDAKRGATLGVTDILTGQKTLAEVLQTTPLEKLFLLSAGSTAPNPAELLAQGGFNGLIEQALKEFDRVVVDSAPIHAVSDTLLMLPRIQTVCLVVRATKTPRRSVLRCVHILRSAAAPISGIVLNRMPRRRSAYYYDPFYDYRYYGKYSKKGVYGG